jgi:hypothetical protein
VHEGAIDRQMVCDSAASVAWLADPHVLPTPFEAFLNEAELLEILAALLKDLHEIFARDFVHHRKSRTLRHGFVLLSCEECKFSECCALGNGCELDFSMILFGPDCMAGGEFLQDLLLQESVDVGWGSKEIDLAVAEKVEEMVRIILVVDHFSRSVDLLYQAVLDSFECLLRKVGVQH